MRDPHKARPKKHPFGNKRAIAQRARRNVERIIKSVDVDTLPLIDSPSCSVLSPNISTQTSINRSCSSNQINLPITDDLIVSTPISRPLIDSPSCTVLSPNISTQTLSINRSCSSTQINLPIKDNLMSTPISRSFSLSADNQVCNNENSHDHASKPMQCPSPPLINISQSDQMSSIFTPVCRPNSLPNSDSSVKFDKLLESSSVKGSELLESSISSIIQRDHSTFLSFSKNDSFEIDSISEIPEEKDRNQYYDKMAVDNKDFFEECNFPSGRFIVNLMHVIEEARKLEEHTYVCNFSGKLIFHKFKKLGLAASFHYRCSSKLCSTSVILNTEKENLNVINHLAVLGALSTGCGFSQEEEKFSCINVRYMSRPSFIQCERVSSEVVNSELEENLKEAIEEERHLAEARNDLDEEGFHSVPVIVDGGWCKRSYGHGYNASSGVAVIIGQHTDKILFIGVRNKVCLVCKAIESNRIPSKQHLCWKNWSSCSTAMESDIIVEGLNYLESVHCIRCYRVIGDGDSNTLSKIRGNVSYGRYVKKIECANHAVRGYRRALVKLQKNSQDFKGTKGIQARKCLKTELNRLVVGARTAIKKHSISGPKDLNEAVIAQLVDELRNGPNHVFGKHDHCKYFCTKVSSSSDYSKFNLLQETGLLDAIYQVANRKLVYHADSLIWNYTNNRAENYMSQLCKTSGGKRVDYSKGGGITRRANIAALAYQKPAQLWHSSVHKQITKSNLITPMKNFISRRQHQHVKRLQRRKLFSSEKLARQKKRTTNEISKGGDEHYGDHPQQADVDEQKMSQLQSSFLIALKVSKNDELESETRSQHQCNMWKEERAKRISSSYFKDVFKRKPDTLSAKLVVRILTQNTPKTKAMSYGIEKEPLAIDTYSKKTGQTVIRCGLFIDVQNPFLCSSPDGLVGEDGLVEVKCPYSARTSGKLSDICKSKNIGLKVNIDGSYYLPTSHKYYYQVQGQLAITQRSWCDLFFWCKNDNVTIRINQNKDLWNKMVPTLEKFYMHCVLPELVDSRHARNLPLREPSYITEARTKNIKIKTKKRQLETSPPQILPIVNMTPLILNVQVDTANETEIKSLSLTREKRKIKPKVILNL